MPWITGSKSTGYRVQWRAGGRGSKPMASPTFHSKGDCEAFKKDLEAQRADEKRQSGVALPSAPLDTLLARWKRSRLASRRAREDYANDAIDRIKAMAKAYKWATVADITAESVDRWRTDKGGKGTETPLRILKGFLRWCRRTLLLRIADGVLELEKQRRPKKPAAPLLSDELVAKILETAYRVGGFPVGVTIEHLALYGCRPVDVSRMTVADWDSAGRIVVYRNTKNADTIAHPVHEEHAVKLDELAKGKKPGDFLFSDPWGRPWRLYKGRADGVSGWYYENIGEHLLKHGSRGVYMLKRYALTRLAYASGGNRAAMASMSGHRTLIVMDRYLAKNDDTQRKMLAAIPAPIARAEIASTAASTDLNAVQPSLIPHRRKRLPPLLRAPSSNPPLST